MVSQSPLRCCDFAAEPRAPQRILLCAGAGLDQVTARELALKIAEGARLPTSALELETVVHGQLAGNDASGALILVAVADHPDRERIARRAVHALEPTLGALGGRDGDNVPAVRPRGDLHAGGAKRAAKRRRCVLSRTEP